MKFIQKHMQAYARSRATKFL